MSGFTEVEACKLYYQTAGTGTAVVFIPGWAYTADLFEKNIPFFAKEFKVVAYDPRSHGRSDVTEQGNNYLQYGRDLNRLLKNLELENVILLGWSLGVTTAYSYFEQFGTDNVQAFISVDETPTIIKQTASDWGEGTEEEVQGLIQLVNSEAYLGFFRDYMAEGFEGDAPEELLNRFTKYAESLSPEMASHLLADAAQRDYSEIAKTVAEEMPMLQILRKDWSEEAIRWIKQNQPTAQTEVLGGHLMVHEFADEFNKIVLDFIKTV